MKDFIDQHRKAFGVEPLCKVLQVTVCVRPSHLDCESRRGKDRVHLDLGGHDDKREGGHAAAVQLGDEGAGVAECAEPGASVAKIVMAHGINANVVHRWRKLARCGDAKAALKTGEFITLPLTTAPAPVPPTATDPAVPDLQVELRRGAITMSITWPTSAAAEFALWTREVLR